MAFGVVTGAVVKCMYGAMPASLVTTSQMNVTDNGKPFATIQDCTMANFQTFSMCTCPSNPAVVAAQGSPVPCARVPAGLWIPKHPNIMAGQNPLLTSDCTCMCGFGAQISIVNPGTQIQLG